MKAPRFKGLIKWGFGIILFLLLLYLGGVTQISRFPEVHWIYVLMLFLSTMGFTLSHNFRWKVIVDNTFAVREGNFFSLYRYLVTSYAVGTVIPMDISLLGLRSYYLSRFQNIPVPNAIFSVLLDRLLDLVILLVMALPSFLYVTRVTSINQSFSIVVVLFAGLFLFAFWKKGDTFHVLVEIYDRFLVRFLSEIPILGPRLAEGKGNGRTDYHFSQSSVYQIIGSTLVKYIFLCLRFYLTGQALGVQFSLIKSFFFLPLIQLSGLISLTPAGLGVVELGTYGALLLMGISRPQMLIFVLGQRILLSLMLVLNFAVSHAPPWCGRLRGLKCKG
jgi:uncharacterized protein (TIRG00374 family)